MDATLPSDRAEHERAQEIIRNREAQARIALMREDFALTFGSEHGKRVLAWLKERCGFRKVILSATTANGIDTMLTTFAAMELNVYLEVTRHIPVDILQQVEYGMIQPSGTMIEDNSGEQKKPNKRTKPKSKRKGA